MNSSKNKQSIVYHLRQEHDGQTLAAVLKELAEDASWGQVKKWIQRRQIQVNGNLCLDEARRVSSKDVVKWFAQSLSKPIEVADIRIAHLDDYLVVVEKPAGVTSVRHFHEQRISTRRRQLQPTLEELLPPVLAKMQRLRWPPLPPVGMNRGKRNTNQSRNERKPSHVQNSKKLPPELQIFPVHRLDRDTSGLMLFARTHAAEQKLVGMFRRHTVRRQYQAFCKGTVDPQQIRTWLIRDRGDGVRGSLDQDPSAEEQGAALEAITHILASEPIVPKSNQAYSQLTCRLETGRTHQIRIHLAELGHPICGDKIYHKLADGQVIEDASQAPRHALHSHLLEFTHPFSGEHLRFEMPLPADLKQWLKRLQSDQQS
ncbi:MAG: RluA family pseudouridine synthase [Planctomycetota bacterium]